MGAKQISGGRFFINGKDGAVADGWKVETHTAGSAGVLGTDDKAAYTDYTLGTPHVNPIILNERGEAEIWWDGAYLIKVYDESDNLIYTLDYFGAGYDAAFDPASVPLNGSFSIDENGDDIPDNWTATEEPGGTVAISTVDAVKGLESLTIVSTQSDGGGTCESDAFEVVAGEIRVLQFEYRATAATSLNSIDIRFYNYLGVLISTSNAWSEGAANSLTWDPIEVDVTVPASARTAKILITGINGAGTTKIGAVYFDNVRFNIVNTSAIKQVHVADSVNDITVTPATTTNKPSINQTGDDDVGVDIEGVEVHNGAIVATGSVAAGNAGFSTGGNSLDSTGLDLGDEVLSNYDEGTWTPVLMDPSLSEAESQTYSQQFGFYTRVGNMVFFSFYLSMSSLGGLSGNAYLGGFPFTSRANNGSAVNFSVDGHLLSKTANQSLFGRMALNTTYAQLKAWGASTTQSSSITVANITASGHIYGSGVYFV